MHCPNEKEETWENVYRVCVDGYKNGGERVGRKGGGERGLLAGYTCDKGKYEGL